MANIKKSTSSTSKKTNNITQQAYAYHMQGYSIIPVGQNKRPTISSWKKYQTEQVDLDTLGEWFNKDTSSNIGIVTGKLSNLTVIDIDNKGENGQERADMLLKKFPKTYTVQTPSKGYHLYYTYAEGFTVSANAYPQYPNVDIRGETGYVVAPPSKTQQGEYTVIDSGAIASFPTHLFPKSKPKKTLTEQTTASKGNRNDTLASFTGKLLQATQENEWESEVYPAVQRANLTYNPPLPLQEVRAVFDSIVKKEQARRADLIVSPIQLENGEKIPATSLKLRRNSANAPYKDMSNVLIVLENHPYYKGAIRYNSFRHEIEYNGKAIEDSDLVKIQNFMQTNAGLPSISAEPIYSAITHYAQKNKYDEAQDWLKKQEWDGVERLGSWLTTATGVPDDLYHSSIGLHWFMGIVRRIMEPGCVFDYMLVITGGQGLGKTSLFRIIGGAWYKSFTGSIDNKDFYLALRGAVIVDLDEGATLYKSEAIKIKSIITETHDEFRAPYERLMKRYPRRFVFSMSTNDSEPFRDVTGNRRYWVLDIDRGVDFKWLEENRDQLYAEAYHYYKNKVELPEVPLDIAREVQEAHLPDDSWTDIVAREVRKSYDYCSGDKDYSTTVPEIFEKIFPNESILRFDRRQEMRVANIFKKELGLEKQRRMEGGQRVTRWYLSERKIAELQQVKIVPTRDPLDEFDEPKQSEIF